MWTESLINGARWSQLKSQSNHQNALDADAQLKTLGWNKYFKDQVMSTDISETPPVRITQVHRSKLHVVGVNIDLKIPSLYDVAVGDWLLLNHKDPRSSKVLKRKSLLKRRAAGHDRREQLIAATSTLRLLFHLAMMTSI